MREKNNKYGISSNLFILLILSILDLFCPPTYNLKLMNCPLTIGGESEKKPGISGQFN